MISYVHYLLLPNANCLCVCAVPGVCGGVREPRDAGVRGGSQGAQGEFSSTYMLYLLDSFTGKIMLQVLFRDRHLTSTIVQNRKSFNGNP